MSSDELLIELIADFLHMLTLKYFIYHSRTWKFKTHLILL